MEDRFNHWAHYDYVFLNDEVSRLSYLENEAHLAAVHRRIQGVSFHNYCHWPELIARHTQRLTNANCQYGLIEHDHWVQPEW